MAELRRREHAQCDVRISDIFDHPEVGDMFTINHPGNRVLVELARRIQTALGRPADAVDPGRELLGEVRHRCRRRPWPRWVCPAPRSRTGGSVLTDHSVRGDAPRPMAVVPRQPMGRGRRVRAAPGDHGNRSGWHEGARRTGGWRTATWTQRSRWAGAARPSTEYPGLPGRSPMRQRIWGSLERCCTKPIRAGSSTWSTGCRRPSGCCTCM